jgi:hypothetical protein
MQHAPETIAAVNAPLWAISAAPLRADDAIEINARYVERFYLPKLGPTALLLARWFAVETTNGGTACVSAEHVGAALGTKPSHVRTSMLRLIQFRLVDNLAGRFVIHHHVPLLDDKQIRRLPLGLRDDCRAANEAIEQAAARAI